MVLQNYIEGRWEEPAIGLRKSVCDANDGDPLFEQRASSNEQLERALRLAGKTHADNRWLAQPAERRAADLEQVATHILARADAIAHADAQLTGVVISLTEKFAGVCAGAFRQAAELVRNSGAAEPESEKRESLHGPYGPLLIERLPLGPAAVISPWNAPAGIASHKLASALAAGCPVVLKPSEWAPLSAQLITEAVSEADLPPGMLQLLHGDGDFGATLVRDERVRAVSFTGGLRGGRAVAAACARDIKPAQLELGGNNPLVVLEDADLDAAIAGVVTALTTLNGQWCRAIGRLLVHESLYRSLLEGVMERLRSLRLGSSLDAASEMGPLVHAAHRDYVAARVRELQEQGGELHQTTPLPDLPGWFYAPALVTGVAADATLDEIFGPVATVHTFTTDEQAVALANQTPFGLAAYVFGSEPRAWNVASRIRAGITKLNGVTMLNLHPLAPRPAWGLSGLGDEGTHATYEFFRGNRVIGVAGRPGSGVEG